VPALGTPFLGFVNYLGSHNDCLCQSLCPLLPCNVVESAAKRGLLGAGLPLAPSLVSLTYFIAGSFSYFQIHDVPFKSDVAGWHSCNFYQCLRYLVDGT
jgi:hypothetical protein